MLAGCLALATLIIRLFPDTELAKALHKRMVDEPLRWLARFERRHMLLAGVLIVLMMFGGELLLLAGGADALIGIAWSTSAYMDAVVATWTVAAVASVRGAWSSIRAKSVRLAPNIGRRRVSVRAVGRARATMQRSAENDDEPAALKIAA